MFLFSSIKRPAFALTFTLALLVSLPIGILLISRGWVFPRAASGHDSRLFQPSTYYFPFFPVGPSPDDLAAAAGVPPGRWRSVLFTQNPATQPARVNFKIYSTSTGASLLSERNITIPAGGLDEFTPDIGNLSQEQILSIEIKSNLAVAPILRTSLEFTNQYQVTALKGISRYQVFLSKSLPIILRGRGRNQQDRLETTIYLYNPRKVRTLASISIFGDRPHHPVVALSAALEPHQQWAVSSRDLGLAEEFRGSVIINGSVAAVAVIQSDKRLYTYSAISNNSTVANFSASNIVSSYQWNWTDILAIQGHGSGPGRVSIIARDSAGRIKNESQWNIQPNASQYIQLAWSSHDGLIQITSLDNQPFSAALLKQTAVYSGDIFSQQAPSDLVFLPFTGQSHTLPNSDWVVRIANPTDTPISFSWWQYDQQGSLLRSGDLRLLPYRIRDLYPYFPYSGYKLGSMVFKPEAGQKLIVSSSRQEWLRDSHAPLAGDGFLVYAGYSAESLTPSPPPLSPIPLKQLLANWLTSHLDQNADGRVNSLDFVTLLLP